MMIPVAYTIIDEYAVMIEFGYASLANTAMLRTCWFQEMTCITRLTRMKDRKIIRV